MASFFSQVPKLGRISRRRMMSALGGAPFLGGLAAAALHRRGWCSYEEQQLAARSEDTAPTPGAAAGKLPYGTIGKLKLSRFILGGNLMGGWAHSRDLIYVSRLLKQYHTREKTFETLQLAESLGVNALLTNPLLCEVINDYWKSTGGKIQFISDCGGKDLLEMIQLSIDKGASACYIQGQKADNLLAAKDFGTIAKALDLIRKNGLPAGIGGHYNATIAGCIEQGVEPDFWMKTLHRGDYWSAQATEKHDNFWCEEPERTIAMMKELKQPWIAFKTLAAGAIRPKEGFRYAFENGADFICVGSFDFQIAENVATAAEVLASKLPRQREWRA